MPIATEPSLIPLHRASVTVGVKTNAPGSEMVALVVSTQPFASVTVTEMLPAARLSALLPVSPLVQAYVNGAVPPLSVTVAEPVAAPGHNTSV